MTVPLSTVLRLVSVRVDMIRLEGATLNHLTAGGINRYRSHLLRAAILESTADTSPMSCNVASSQPTTLILPRCQLDPMI